MADITISPIFKDGDIPEDVLITDSNELDAFKQKFDPEDEKEYTFQVLDMSCFADDEERKVYDAYFPKNVMSYEDAERWFDEFDNDNKTIATLLILADNGGKDFEEALNDDGEINVQGPYRSEEEACAEYAEEFTTGCHKIPEFLSGYINWEDMGKDMEREGAFSIWEVNGQHFTYRNV